MVPSRHMYTCVLRIRVHVPVGSYMYMYMMCTRVHVYMNVGAYMYA